MNDRSSAESTAAESTAPRAPAAAAGAAASPAASPELEPAVDARNPWLGLASFTEETRSFFFGRDEEVAELARRVQRKLLTILFGKSGLGKTSILRAGLVPRLREHGYCPVYVRIDYARDTPEPAEQIKEAIRRAAAAAGQWSQVGVAAEGESLWEFLHHRDDVLRDASGATLTPLLIFDQFEELFTLAQSDEFGRARAARFIDELADLVENRPPRELEARIERDEDAAERFDFARSDYRVLIALREDYLAPLESLKRMMPSISQNRLRLAPMTGAQALEAVLRPGRRLVSEEVAAAIVRFVAGGAEIANAEVEPSLLSLICRELNDARIAQGRTEISLDLLAGSHESILTNFYERALGDQPAAVRQIIEDELLTESGFRENVAEESLQRRFAAAGAAPDTLAKLVNRRLLRIEERLDVRRVELTHDVLSGVVKASRDQRHEREALEATERTLAEQRAREQAARNALRRARTIAAGCILLAVVAVAAAGFAYFSAQRARSAERIAQQTRATAEQARTQSELLLGYLTDDFARELESFGRLQVLTEFSQRQIDYFHAVPPALQSAVTMRNGALALINHAKALRYLGQLDVGGRNSDEAIQLLEGLRRQGDQSDVTLVALGRAYSIRSMILDNQNSPGGPEDSARAAAILQPLATKPGASIPARRAYVEALTRIGFEGQNAGVNNEGAVRVLRQAMQIAVDLGARDLSNLDMSADYAEAGAWLMSALANLGRNEEARQVGKDVTAMTDEVLEQRPGYRLVLHAKQVAEAGLSGVAQLELDPSEAMRYAREGERTSYTLLKLDPNNVTSLNNLGVAQTSAGDAAWASGRLDEAVDWYRKSLDPFGEASKGGLAFVIVRGQTMAYTALRQAVAGDLSGAAATVATAGPYIELVRRRAPPGSVELLVAQLDPEIAEAEVHYQRDDFGAARRLTAVAIAQLHGAKPSNDFDTKQVAYRLFYFANTSGHAEYHLGHFAAAEQAERLALEQHRIASPDSIGDKRDMAGYSTWLAMALARQGKLAEAAQVAAPVVTFEQGLLARNHGDVWVPYELAGALYAQSLTDPQRSTELRARAAAMLNRLPPALQRLHDVKQWRRMIVEQPRTTRSAAEREPAAAVRRDAA
jgi:Novel STAND NTPase 1